MEINGKEYGLFYSVGANIAFNNWVVGHAKSSYAEGIIQKFTFMVLAYNELNGIKDNDPPTKEELAKMPNYIFEEIMAAVLQQEKEDSTRKVEAEPKGNAKSTVKKSH